MGRNGALLAALLLAATGAAAQQDPKPGFNLFSVEQDIEIGRLSAAEAERELPILRDASLERYLNDVAGALREVAPGARYPYRIRAVASPEVNAFTFPGGFIYVNRGLLEAARTESELAGVLGHEMAHVALRHGTHQASKAYAANAGLGILGGLLGGDRGKTGQILQVIGGVGLNAVFLKFSRNAEYEADLVGVRMLRQARYEPRAMADFFELLRQQQQRDPGKLEQFFSSHPAPADRAARLEAEAARLGPVGRPREVGGFAAMRSALRGLPSDARRTARYREPAPAADRDWGNPRAVRIEPPSTRLSTYRQRGGFFEIDFPENWSVHEAEQGYGVVIAPREGIVAARDGSQGIVYGAVVNHYDPFDRGPDGGTLDDAAEDLARQIRSGNPHLGRVGGSERRETLDGARARSFLLSGRSPVTGREERVQVLVRELADDHVLYALFVAPRDDYAELARTFERMAGSLRVDDRAAHR
jgi:Zn-dependent protease with chaperone function